MEQENFNFNPDSNQVTSKRNVLLWALVALAILAVVFFGTKKFIEDYQTAKQQASQGNKDKFSALLEILPKVECSFGNDKEAYAKAIEISNISVCDCISDEAFKGQCKEVTFDLNSYNQAIKQYDPEICKEITDTSIKQACLTIAKSGINNLKEKDPKFLANVYSNAHNSSAIQTYENLLKTEPNNLKNLLALSLAYAEAGLKEQEQGRSQTPYVEKALATIEKSKSLYPNNSEVFRVEGYIYEIKPEIFKAISIYDKAIKLDAKNILAYSGRGHAKSMVGILEEALADLKKAAELDKNKQYTSIYTNLCRLESSKGDMIEEAIKDCKIVATTENADPVFKAEAYQILAFIFIQTKNFPEAESYLLKAQALSPKDPNLYVALANLAIAKEQYIEAQTAAQKAVALSPTKAVSYQALAYALYKQEKYTEAITAAKKGLNLVENDVSLLAPNKSALNKDLYYTLANIYNRINDKKNEMKYKELGDAALALSN